MKRLWLAVCCLVYILIFFWGYRSVVVPVFASEGFVFYWPGSESIAWVTVLSLTPLVIIPLELSKPSVLIVWWLYVAAYVPGLLIPAVTLFVPDSQALPLQISVLCTMLLLCAVPYASTLILPNLVIPRAMFWWVFALVWTGCIIVCLANISFSRLVSNYALMLAGSGGGSEYIVRGDFETQVSQGGRLIAYAGKELATALDPFLIAYGILSKRWRLMVLGLIGQFIYVGQTGMKEVVVAVFLIWAVWLLRRTWRRFGFVFLLGVSGLVAIATCTDLATHSAMLSTHITRRSLAGPGQLTGYYFEHYSSVAHPGHKFSGEDGYGPSNEIGYYYFNNINVDANANFWAEGFAEYGLPGIFAFAFLVAFCLWIYDSIAARHSLELAVLLAVVQADALVNGSPLTILVTGGGILAGILLYLAPEIGPSQHFDANQCSDGQKRAGVGMLPPAAVVGGA